MTTLRLDRARGRLHLPAAVRFFRGQRDGADRVLARPHASAGEARQPPRRASSTGCCDARERLIGALLLGNNAVNIAASSLATGVLLNWFGDVGVVYATIVMTARGGRFRRSAAEDRRLQRAGPHRAAGRAPDAIGRCGCSAPVLIAVECAGAMAAALARHAGRRGPVDHVAARGAARHRRSAAPRRRRREARPRHVRRPARPARSRRSPT